MDNKYCIGEHYGGGIVFWIDETSEHGLVVSKEDISRRAEWDEAVRLCIDYNGEGYTDWYLPSKEEFSLLYEQKGKVGGFADIYYWSSIEYDSNFAWYQSFIAGGQNYCSKDYTLWVRAVRAF